MYGVYEIAELKPGPLEPPPPPPPDARGVELARELSLAGEEGGSGFVPAGVEAGAGIGAAEVNGSFGAGAGFGAGIEEGGETTTVGPGVDEDVEAGAVPTIFFHTVVVETGLSSAST